MLHFTLPLPALHACLSWLIAHSDAILSTAHLLGSHDAARRAGRLIQSATEQTTITRRFMSELGWLYGLMTLEAVSDFDTMESVCFAEIGPDHPAIAEICLLAESLMEHIQAVRAEAQKLRSMNAA